MCRNKPDEMLEGLPSMHDVKEEQQAPITSGVDSGQAKMAPLDRENKSFKTLHRWSYPSNCSLYIFFGIEE